MNPWKVKSHWDERWAKVVTWYPTRRCDYYISDYARIKSVDKELGKETLLKGSKTNNGYAQLNLTLKENKRQGIYVHKFVAEHFVDKGDDKTRQFVAHLDVDKSNNHFKNLKWMNRAELTAHQVANKVFHVPDKKPNKNVKMNESKVRLLKQRLRRGRTKRKILARDFGISIMQLSRIERGENWGHVS